MEYIRIMKQALEGFEKNLSQDSIRINGFNNDLEKLKGEHSILKAEVDELKQKKIDFDSYMTEQRNSHNAEIDKLNNTANDFTSKAQALYETAKKERGEAKSLLAEAEQESGKVDALKEAWTKKTSDLAAVIGN